MRGEFTTVAGWILPGEFGLDHRDAQVCSHSILSLSAAASSVASCLAKQNRMMRSGRAPALFVANDEPSSAENTEIGIAATPCCVVSRCANSVSGRSLTAE